MFRKSCTGVLQRRFIVQLAEESRSTGLYGFSNLKEPQDWLRLADVAIRECQEIISEIKYTPPSAYTIQLLDNISDKVCQVHDSAEFCRNTHSDAQWRQAAQQTTTHLGGFVAALNANKDLYDALSSSLDRYERVNSNQRASTSSSENIDSVDGYTREAVHVGRLLKRDFDKAGIALPEKDRQQIIALHSAIYSTGSLIGQNLMMDRHQQSSQSPHAMLYNKKERTRRQGWLELQRSPEANVELMKHLADSRMHLAQLLGAESYADYALDSATLAGQPAAVTGFLSQLHASIQPQMEEEIDLLRSQKRKITGDSSEVCSWDRDLLVRSYRETVLPEGSSQPSPYFTFPSLINGFGKIIRTVFGVDLSLEELQPGEAWADGIIKLGFSSSEEGCLGHVYIDAEPRPSKFAGCAHFTLRCRKTMADGDIQLPLVALVFHFGSQFTPSQARTFFHELGHAMHSILSKTQFQHLSGTRGPLDMIEIPSHFFEHFLTSTEGLKLCCKDQNGNPLPSSLADTFQKQWTVLPALEMNDSIVHSMMDQVFHNRKQPGTDLSEDMQNAVCKFSPFPGASLEESISPHLRFGHLVGYPASYYSYVYAQFIAGALWRKSFQNDPLSREAGDHVKAKLLSLGGSKEPRALLEDLLGPESLQNIGGGWAPVAQI